MRAHASVLPLLLLALAAGDCSAGRGPDSGSGAESAAQAEAPVPVGAVTREQIEDAAPEWVTAEVEAAPDETAARALATVPPGRR